MTDAANIGREWLRAAARSAKWKAHGKVGRARMDLALAEQELAGAEAALKELDALGEPAAYSPGSFMAAQDIAMRTAAFAAATGLSEERQRERATHRAEKLRARALAATNRARDELDRYLAELNRSITTEQDPTT